MATPNTSIDAKNWLMSGPTPLEIVARHLNEQHGVNACVQGQRLSIRSMFCKLPLVKEILEQHGLSRKRWPKPPPKRNYGGGRFSRPGAAYLWLVVPHPDKEVRAVVIKLGTEQRRRLEALAGGRSLHETAQSAFD